MATKTSRARATRTTTHKQKGTVERLVDSAVSATEELGAAATAFKESWNHVKKARAKGAPATHAISRTATRAGKATVRAAKRVMPGRKSRRK